MHLPSVPAPLHLERDIRNLHHHESHRRSPHHAALTLPDLLGTYSSACTMMGWMGENISFQDEMAMPARAENKEIEVMTAPRGTLDRMVMRVALVRWVMRVTRMTMVRRATMEKEELQDLMEKRDQRRPRSYREEQ